MATAGAGSPAPRAVEPGRRTDGHAVLPLRRLVADYIDWLAPYLLTLPRLDPGLRGYLEEQAAKQAVLLDALWRPYPDVADRGLLQRARVEAKLRRANT